MYDTGDAYNLQGKQRCSGEVALIGLVSPIQWPSPQCMAESRCIACFQLRRRLQAPLCAQVSCRTIASSQACKLSGFSMQLRRHAYRQHALLGSTVKMLIPVQIIVRDSIGAQALQGNLVRIDDESAPDP